MHANILLFKQINKGNKNQEISGLRQYGSIIYKFS